MGQREVKKKIKFAIIVINQGILKRTAGKKSMMILLETVVKIPQLVQGVVIVTIIILNITQIITKMYILIRDFNKADQSLNAVGVVKQDTHMIGVSVVPGWNPDEKKF